MASSRTRPTRADTRQRLFEAAAAVFAAHGVAGATVGQITDAAGFSRGAFYSNFATKEELALAMLEDHLAVGQRHNRALAERHPHAADLIDALRHDDRDDPLHRNPLLQVEIMLHVARSPELRPAVAAHLRAMRSLVGDIAAATVQLDVDAARLGLVLVALEDGLRLHRLVDPDGTPADAFLDALALLQRLLGVPPFSTSTLRSPDVPGPADR